MTTEIPSLSLFLGDDTIGRDQAKQKLVRSILKKFSGVGEEHFDSDKGPLARFLEKIITPSLFQNVRIFFIRHAEQFSKDDFKQFSQILSSQIPDVYLIVEADESDDPDKKGGYPKDLSAWLKQVEKISAKRPGSITVNTFVKPRDYDMAKWLVSQVPLLFDRNILLHDAEYLVELAGYDCDRLYGELGKIDVYLPPQAPVDAATIKKVVESSRPITGFELAQALGKKEMKRALDYIESIFSSQFYAPVVVAAIFRHFWALFRIRELHRLKPQTIASFLQASKSRNFSAQNRLGLEIGMAAGILTANQASRIYPAIIKSGIIEQALSFDTGHYKKVFRWLRDYDVGIKTGYVDDSKSGFQLLSYKLVFGDDTP